MTFLAEKLGFTLGLIFLGLSFGGGQHEHQSYQPHHGVGNLIWNDSQKDDIGGQYIHVKATLGDKQRQFTQLVAKLVLRAQELGYEVTLGEAWRSTECASYKTKIYEEQGKGIARSLHTQRLAIDLNLFRSGKFLTATADYATLGQWWEGRCNLCRWGGRFKREDGNHFSVEHEGIK